MATINFTNFFSQIADEWGSIQGTGASVVILGDGLPALQGVFTGSGNQGTAKFLGLLLPQGVTSGAWGSTASSYVRFYVNFSSLPASALDMFFNMTDTTDHWKLVLNILPSGKIQVNGANAGNSSTSNTLATSNTVLSLNTWYRLEVQINTGASAFWELKIAAGDAAATETLNGNGNLSTLNGFELGFGRDINVNGQTYTFFTRDVLWSNSGYPGPGHCAVLVPAGDGFYANGTANGAATRWQCLADLPPDVDVSYVNGLGQNQAYTAQTGVPIYGKIIAVKSYARGRSNDGVTGVTYNVRLRSAGVDVDTGAAGVGNLTYISRQRVFDTDPATGQAWTHFAANAAQVGFVQNTVAPVRVTACYLMADYLASPIVGAPALTGSSERISLTGG